MKKNVVIGVLSLMLLTMIIFSFIKASEAEKAAMEAIRQQQLAQEHMRAAELHSELAAKKTAEAQMALEEAKRVMEELLKCQGK